MSDELHTHHFTPRPTGKRNSQGEPINELRCDCGSTPNCPECGGTNGQHGLVHRRYPEGGGGTNRPCSRATLDPSRIGHRGMR